MAWHPDLDSYDFICSLDDLAECAREYGLKNSHWQKNQSIGDLIKNIDEGNPAIVLQWADIRREYRHFRAVIGYDSRDARTETIIMHDPEVKYHLFPDYMRIPRDNLEISFRMFNHLRNTGDCRNAVFYLEK